MTHTPCPVCAFPAANNQHDLSTEVVSDVRQSSFFRAMTQASTKGTVSVVDHAGMTFSRIWCVFELYVSLVDMAKRRQHGNEDLYVMDEGVTLPEPQLAEMSNSPIPRPAAAAAPHRYTYDMYTSKKHSFRPVLGYGESRSAVGLTDGLAQNDLSHWFGMPSFGSASFGQSTGRKTLRELHFPLELLQTAISFDCSKGESSVIRDKVAILAELEKDGAVETLNNTVHGFVAASALRRAIESRDAQLLDQFLETLRGGRVTKLQLYCGSSRSLFTTILFGTLSFILFVFGFFEISRIIDQLGRPAFWNEVFSPIIALPSSILGGASFALGYQLMRLTFASEWGTPFDEVMIERIIDCLNPDHLEELSLTSMPLIVNSLPSLGHFKKLKKLTLSNSQARRTHRGRLHSRLSRPRFVVCVSQGLERLPESLSECVQLEALDLYNCGGLTMLPDLSKTKFGRAIQKDAVRVRALAESANQSTSHPNNPTIQLGAPPGAEVNREEQKERMRRNVHAINSHMDNAYTVAYEHAQAFTGISPVLHSKWLLNKCKETKPPELLAHRHSLRCDGSGCRMAPSMMIVRSDAFKSLCCLYCCGLYANLFKYTNLMTKNATVKQQWRVGMCCLCFCPFVLIMVPVILMQYLTAIN